MVHTWCSNFQGSWTGPVRSPSPWRQLCRWSWRRCWRCWNDGDPETLEDSSRRRISPEDLMDRKFSDAFGDGFWSDWLFDVVWSYVSLLWNRLKGTSRISPTIIHFTTYCDELNKLWYWPNGTLKVFFQTTTRHISDLDLDRRCRAQNRSNTEPLEDCSAPSVSGRHFKSIDWPK